MHKDYCMKCLRDKLNWSFFLVLQTATNLQLVFRNISCEHPEMWSWSASNLIFPCCQSQEMPHQVATRVCHADAKLPVAMCASCQVPFVFSAKMWASRSQCPWNEGFVKVPTIPPWIYLYINMLLSYWVFWPNFLSNKVVPKINMSSFNPFRPPMLRKLLNFNLKLKRLFLLSSAVSTQKLGIKGSLWCYQPKDDSR